MFESKLGPLPPENHIRRRYSTQNKPKQDNSLVHRLLVRDQGVGGSNPLPDQEPKRMSKHRSERKQAERRIENLPPVHAAPEAVAALDRPISKFVLEPQ